MRASLCGAHGVVRSMLAPPASFDTHAGIKSGGASLRFVRAPFHKNIDGLIERVRQPSGAMRLLWHSMQP